MGRPSTYNETIAAEICERLAEGETLRSICRDEHTPKWQTVYKWMADRSDFADRIARARELGFDAIAADALEIADTPEEGVRIEHGKDGTKTTHEDMLGHRKLRIETRLKLLAKWDPKRYGERQAVDLSGSLAIHQMSDAEMEAEIAALQGQLGLLRTEESPEDDGSDLV